MVQATSGAHNGYGPLLRLVPISILRPNEAQPMAGIGQAMPIKAEECGTESSSLEHGSSELAGQSIGQPEPLVDETRWLEVVLRGRRGLSQVSDRASRLSKGPQICECGKRDGRLILDGFAGCMRRRTCIVAFGDGSQKEGDY
jgi:hypothetical protein